jgi:site-specific DNA-methyltransferase (adenine-specific)
MLSSSPVADVLTGSACFAVECARAEDLADRLPDKCANLLWLDIPYFKVKTDQAWDCAWPTADAFLAWLDERCQQWRRILAPNGSLYVFASPLMSFDVERVVRGHFEVLTNIRWLKPVSLAERACKENLRSPFPASETILFCEQRGADLVALNRSGYAAKDAEARAFIFEPLRAYLDSERQRAGITSSAVQKALGNQMAGHYFGRSQWALPTAENYAKLQALFNRDGAAEFLRREYEDLRREYEDLRREYEDLRRPFFATPERPYTDVWTYPVVQSYDGKHPCEKPPQMCEDALLLSSRPGDLVVDLFCGSGGIGAAAMAHGRRFIGGDMDPHWRDFTERRCAMTIATGKTSTRKVVQAHPAQMSFL